MDVRMGNPIGSMFGVELVAVVILGFAAAIACAIAAPIVLGWWGVALSVWHAFNALVGYNQLKRMKFEARPLDNGESAFAFTVVVQFAAGAILAFDPPHYSAAWALLMPLWFFPCMAITWCADKVLTTINPAGRNPYQ